MRKVKDGEILVAVDWLNQLAERKECHEVDACYPSTTTDSTPSNKIKK